MMLKIKWWAFGLVAAALMLPLTSFAGTNWNVNVAGGNGGLSGFSLSVGDYYKVPEPTVIAIHDRGIREDELPVVFFLARRAHVAPETIVNLRLRGLSWMDITLRYNLDPSIYYVPVDFGPQGPPRGHAYGYYRDCPRRQWRHIYLNDADVVNQVNLMYISERHGCPPARVIRARAAHRAFYDIDDDFGRGGRHRHGDDRD